MDKEEWYLANTYLPHRKKKQGAKGIEGGKRGEEDSKKDKEDEIEARETVAQLLQDVQQIKSTSGEALIVVVGDMNADPFTKKGSNITWLKWLTSGEEGLRVVQRPDDSAVTRPAKGAHIDNILTNAQAMKKVRGPLVYFMNNEIDDMASERIPSDHVPIMAELACRRAGTRVRSKETQWNTLELRADAAHPYCYKLEALTNDWLKWARRVCEAHLALGARCGTENSVKFVPGPTADDEVCCV